MVEKFKTRPPILTDYILKNEIAQELAKELRVNEAFMNKHSELFMSYINVKLQLRKYVSTIPYKELENYNKLRYQEAKIYLELKELTGEPILDLDLDALEDYSLGVCHG